MFDFSFNELLVIAAVGLLVLGPKELPTAARALRKMMRSVTAVTSSVKQQINDALDAEEMKEITDLVKGDDGTYYEAYTLDECPEDTPPPKLTDS